MRTSTSERHCARARARSIVRQRARVRHSGVNMRMGIVRAERFASAPWATRLPAIFYPVCTRTARRTCTGSARAAW
eukprot:2312685-Pyramimonas_sp.AAC.1